MFIGCSEININVFVKHEQHIGIIRVCVPGAIYSVPWGTENINESRFARGISTQAGAMVYHGIFIYKYIYIYIYWFSYWERLGGGRGGGQLKLYLYLFFICFNFMFFVIGHTNFDFK